MAHQQYPPPKPPSDKQLALLRQFGVQPLPTTAKEAFLTIQKIKNNGWKWEPHEDEDEDEDWLK